MDILGLNPYHNKYECNLYFDCGIIKSILKSWSEEINWLSLNTKGKGWKLKVLKMAYIETIYSC